MGGNPYKILDDKKLFNYIRDIVWNFIIFKSNISV